MDKNTLKFWEKIEEQTIKASTWRYTTPDPFQIFVDKILDESNERIKQLCFELAKETTNQVLEAYKYFNSATIKDTDHILERIFDKVWEKKIKELEKERENNDKVS